MFEIQYIRDGKLFQVPTFDPKEAIETATQVLRQRAHHVHITDPDGKVKRIKLSKEGYPQAVSSGYPDNR